jgi:serine O-acetyltransferase
MVRASLGRENGRVDYGATLRADIRRTYDSLEGRPLRKVLACVRAPGVHAVVVYRYGQWVRERALAVRLALEPDYFLFNILVQVLWGIELPRGATIGAGLYIGHFGGITISSCTVMGRDCNVSQGVTIGVEGHGERRGAPSIGDDVFIGPGARLFGKIRVGNNVKIGANAVIYRDIPDNAVCALDPGFRILSFKGNRRTLGRAA